MFDHNICCFSFTNIHLQVCLKAKNKDSCAKSKSKCFNTTCVTHLNIARMFRDLDSSLGFSSFLSNLGLRYCIFYPLRFFNLSNYIVDNF